MPDLFAGETMTPTEALLENTSGHGPASVVPREVDRWNWGAFLLHWIWGIGNRTWIALLMFVPFVNLVMMVVLGVRGSAWAWQNRRWDSVAHFQRVQRRWAWWGAGVWAATLVGFVVMMAGLLHSFRQSEAYRLSFGLVQRNEAVAAVVGRPMTPGFPMGSLEVAGPRGRASLSYGVSGPKGEGTVHVEATRDLGRWQIDRAVFEDDATGQRIDLVTGGTMSEGACRRGDAGCV
jgi:hypothetical protein